MLMKHIISIARIYFVREVIGEDMRLIVTGIKNTYRLYAFFFMKNNGICELCFSQ